MNDELKDLLIQNNLSELYKNNLFTLKSIAQELGIWDNYSPYEKWKLENFTARDTKLNKNFTYDGEYDQNFTYGEITKSGVDTLNEAIEKYKKPTEKDVFIDIGSGCGKLVIHLSLVSKIKTLIGLEKVELRYLFSKKLKEKFNIGNVFFFNKDAHLFDLNLATIVFINDVAFEDLVSDKIWSVIPSGCHVICSKEKECKILKEELLLDVSWSKRKCKFFYYIK